MLLGMLPGKEFSVSHGSESLTFTGNLYTKANITDAAFLEINQFIADLSHAEQNLLWKFYTDSMEILTVGGSFCKDNLQTLITELYNTFTPVRFYRWLMFSGNLYLPPDLKEYMDENTSFSAEQTYLKQQYIQLCTVSLALRLLVPIFNMYVESCCESRFAEEDCMDLLGETHLTHYGWPEDIRVFDKLLTQVEEILKSLSNSASDMTNISNGTSSQDIPRLIMAKVIVRRLTVVALSAQHAEHSVIANVHYYVKSNYKKNDRGNGGIDDKEIDKRSLKDPDEKTSVLETYKSRGRLAPGDIVALEEMALDWHLIVNRIDPSLDKSIIERCINHKDTKQPINIHAVMLAAWVLGHVKDIRGPAYPPQAFQHISPRYVRHLIQLTQGILWCWGMTDLAVLMTATQSENLIARAPRNNSRIVSKFRDELDRCFPHRKINNAAGTDLLNYGSIGINELTVLIRSREWIYTGPNWFLNKCPDIDEVGGIVIRNELKTQLTDLLIRLAK